MNIQSAHPLARKTFVALGVLLVAIQFVSGSLPESGSNRVHMVDVIDPQVGAILDRSCQDCHSANTRLPWYGRVAPISWIIARDVRRGRGKWDFSEWPGRSHTGNERMEICDAVSKGNMPIGTYSLLHPDARLQSQDVDRICEWATSPDGGKQGVGSADRRSTED